MIILDSPPEFADPGSIESYAEKPQIFGVIRAKLVHQSSNSIIHRENGFLNQTRFTLLHWTRPLITEEIGLLAHLIANRRMLDQLNQSLLPSRKDFHFLFYSGQPGQTRW